METTYFTINEWARIRGLLGVSPGQAITAKMLCDAIAGVAAVPTLSLSLPPADLTRDPLDGLGDVSFGPGDRMNPLIADAAKRQRQAATLVG